MQQTTNYQLHQWDAEDRILREDFNQDHRRIDEGLTAVNAAVVAERQAREQAVAGAKNEAAGLVTAEQQARTQAVAGAKQEAASAVAGARQEASAAAAGLASSKADRTETSALSSRIDAMPLVKLMDVTTGATVTQVDLNFSGINLQQYARVIVIPRMISAATEVYVLANGLCDKYYYQQQSSVFKFAVSFKTIDSCIQYLLNLSGMDDVIHFQLHRQSENGVSSDSGAVTRQDISIPPASFRTLNFVAQGGGTIQAGSKFTVYGVKL